MPSINILRTIDIKRTPRVMQMEGIFDVAPSEKSTETWNVDLRLPDEWNVGLIVGPSGSGKTTIVREMYGDYICNQFEWSKDKSILDDFPSNMGIKDIVDLLSSVGFNSPPSWVRPFNVLSNGEQFRVNMARMIANNKELTVMDEFTSVIDRTVAQIGSAAIQKTIRRRNQKFIAVSCHYDIIDWLEPDWVYQPHTGEFYTGRYLHQRPKINLEIRRVYKDAWKMFRKHHYLNTELHEASACFVAFWNNIPVAFTAILHFPHPNNSRMKREHRTVCLPDYQGIGIGNRMSDYMASIVKGLGYDYFSITSHPGMVRSRNNSNNWKLKSKNSPRKSGWSSTSQLKKWSLGYLTRINYSFQYVGPAMPYEDAIRIWNK